jgi:diacylglycerol kinase (ATP)
LQSRTGTDVLGTDVLVNRSARRLGEPDGLRRQIADAAERCGARFHETRTLPELERVAQEIALRGTSAVVLAGGDGSYMAGLTALWHAHAEAGRPLPPVGLAPGGTVCTIARNFGMRGPAPLWAQRVVRAACDGTGRVEHRPTLRVRDDRGGDRIGFIFGGGLVMRFFEIYCAVPQQGLAAAAKLAARIVAGSFTGSALARRVLDPTPCSLVVDGDRQPAANWSLVLASVVRDVGLHFLVPYRAGEELERFHVVATGLPPRALGRRLPRALTGRPLAAEPGVDVLARSLQVVFERIDDGYVLDGDVFRAGSATVEAGPVISVLSPPAARPDGPRYRSRPR